MEQYSPIPTQKCTKHQETCGDEGTDVHHFAVFSISVICNVPVKETGWGVMKEGKEKREREGGYQRPSEAHCRANSLDFFTHLGCSLTCALHTLTFLLPPAKKEDGKKLRILPWWVGNLSNKTEPSLSLWERSQDCCNCKASHCNCKPGLWATGLLR